MWEQKRLKRLFPIGLFVLYGYRVTMLTVGT
ncbi:hypothetical protein ABIC86_003010 [Paenibacillus sp. DS2363]